MEKHEIYWNLQVWRWYFDINNKKHIGNDIEKQEIFLTLIHASNEDMYLFMRFLLYVANTRTKYTEVKYNYLCHYIASFYPDIVKANIHLITKLGKKSDVLFFMVLSPLREQLTSWIKHESKNDKMFANLLEGIVDKEIIERKIRYAPKFTKNYTWTYFLDKLTLDATLNGLQIGIMDLQAKEQIL